MRAGDAAGDFFAAFAPAPFAPPAPTGAFFARFSLAASFFASSSSFCGVGVGVGWGGG